MPQATIVRSARHGTFRLRTTHWGSYLSACDDPEAIKDFDPAVATKEFIVPEDLHRIPAELWQKWIQLCFHFAPKIVGSSLEVGVRLLVSASDPSQYRIMVPRQSVSGGSVHVTDFNDSVDIATGEAITAFPPEGWIHCGSSHSHGTMKAFWSYIDDNNELGDPGLHITIGSISNNPDKKSYDLCASVTADLKRFRVPYGKVVDCTPVSSTYHPNVLNWVKAERPPAVAIPGLQTGKGKPQGRGFSDEDFRRAARHYNQNGKIDWSRTDDNDTPFSWTPGSNYARPYPLAQYVIERALNEASLDDLILSVATALEAALWDGDSVDAGAVWSSREELFKLKNQIDEVFDMLTLDAVNEEGIFTPADKQPLITGFSSKLLQPAEEDEPCLP
jgi:hypothetical protein